MCLVIIHLIIAEYRQPLERTPQMLKKQLKSPILIILIILITSVNSYATGTTITSKFALKIVSLHNPIAHPLTTDHSQAITSQLNKLWCNKQLGMTELP